MPTIYIDNTPYEVTAGKNLLEACLSLGFDLPYFCWHPALGSVGACRQCAVKVFKDQDDTRGRLTMSCMESVRDNLYLSIQDPFAKAFREEVIEWLMTNHPHDCAICDEGGSCHLQDMTVMTGHNYRRYAYKKRTYNNQYLGPFINHEMNRCIQCYRCVRFYKDYAGGKDLDVFAAHDHVYFGREKDGVLESEFSGNLAEICPTGVFTDKTLKEHYTRKWDLTMAPSVCQHCSAGCNIIAGERYGELRQITNRFNDEVNGYFICDRGRFGYEFVNDVNRIQTPLIRQHVPEAVNRTTLYSKISDLLSETEVIGVGSPRASLESNFALMQLVGRENFYQGISENELNLLEIVLEIYQDGQIKVPSIKEIEQADVIFILGEDPTNTAPRLALAIRSALKRVPMEAGPQIGIPVWHDGANRELIQSDTGDLFIAYPVATKLDELAQKAIHAAPADIARFGFEVARNLVESPPLHRDAENDAVVAIANSLRKAKRPLIIAGTSLFDPGILKAAFNIALALDASLACIVPDCNSLGLAMTGAPSYENVDGATTPVKKTMIILENDLFRHGNQARVDDLLEKFHVIALDHLHNRITNRADVVIPVASFAEADGTLINYEGRAQRFFQVFMPQNENLRESWLWLDRLRQLREGEVSSETVTIDELLNKLGEEWPQFDGVSTLSPSAGVRIAGQKIPREPHRYSGRTAMNAHHQLSEPKPPTDPDSPLSFTMEGFRGIPPAPLTSFFWSPGWNSVQSTNKYQTEVGGPLHGNNPGVRLFEEKERIGKKYFSSGNPTIPSMKGEWTLIPLGHIFGSEELSVYTAGIQERMPPPYLALNQEDASR
ncbi:MAG TPA: NADH-quinone oxidoreductase subunit NuoG, partial [Sphingobacteriaceae bacterium]